MRSDLHLKKISLVTGRRLDWDKKWKGKQEWDRKLSLETLAEQGTERGLWR